MPRDRKMVEVNYEAKTYLGLLCYRERKHLSLAQNRFVDQVNQRWISKPSKYGSSFAILKLADPNDI